MRTRGYNRWGNVSVRDVVFGPAEGGSIWQICPRSLMEDPSVGHGFLEEFRYLPDKTLHWTQVEDGGKTGTDVIVTTGTSGWYQHFADGDNHDESYMSLINVGEFIIAAGKCLFFEARVKCTEINADDANLIIGLSEIGTADFLLDDGGGPAASYDGIVWYKVDGTLAWNFETSLAGAQVTKAAAGAYASATWANLGFMVISENVADTTVLVYPVFNGVVGAAHTLTISGFGPVKPVFGVKAGATQNEESIVVDYIRVVASR